MRKTLLTTLFLLCILGMARAWTNVGLRTTESPNSLTVFPEATSTNNYVPAYVFYWDDFTKSQCVIPASELTYMAGGTITSMKFYTTSNNVPYTSLSTADFFLKEVESETISAYVDKADATIVYSGTIDVVAAGGGGEVTITFNTPFTYNGGNLLIGCENTTDAGWKNIYFVGENGHTGAAIAGSNSASLDDVPATDRGFLPKTTFTYTGGSVAPGPETPTNVAVSEITDNSAKVTWDGTNDSYKLRYRPVLANVVFSDDFESGLDQWVTIDADGDGNTWVHSSAPGIYHNSGVDLSGSGHDGSDGFAISGSYANQTGEALTPDNYLVTADKVALGGVLYFYVCAQDANYAAEHLGVAVSTTSNSDASAFTLLDEWTLTAAPSMKMVSGKKGTQRAQGNWYQYSVDLSAYAGQEGYVAIRHFNCSDQFLLNLDDVEITGPAASPAKRKHVISMLRGDNRASWQTVSATENFADLTGLDANTDYEVQVQGYTGGLTSEWSPIVQFTTLEGTAPVIVNAPTNLAVSNITDQSATVTWNGDADGYEMELGVAGSAEEPVVYDFSDGTLQGWTNLIVNSDGGQWIHSNGNLGGYDYSEFMTDGQFALCYSFVDYQGSYDTDAYLVSPQAFDIVDGSTLTFKANQANPSYPENITVCVAETTGTPTAADFTVVATPTVSTGYDETPTEVTVDLSAYAGKSIWIAFHDQTYDSYEIWIDDVAISGAKKRTITWTSIGDVTSPYDLTGLDPETEYSVRVRGVSGSSTSDWATTTFTTLAAGPVVPAPTDLTISDITSNSAVATWTGSNDSYTLRYRPVEVPVPGDGDTFFVDFEDSAIPEGWTTIDADGDGYGWMLATDAMTSSNLGHNASVDCIISKSYDNTVGALTPDNFLVSPQVTVGAGSTFSFYACGQDASWAAEHFSVAVSTTSNTDASAFTNLQEWTMTAAPSMKKGPGKNGAQRAQGNWYQYSVDLSDYAGQQIYIAIRHFNCTDMFYLDVDDIELSSTAVTAPMMAKRKHVISMLRGEAEWERLDVTEATAELTGLDPETTYEVQVQGITGGEVSEWTPSVQFTTLAAPAVEVPTELAISEITAESAVATWSGTNDSYNIRYRTPGSPAEVFFFEGFEGLTDQALPAGWTTIDADGDGYQWYSLCGESLATMAYEGQGHVCSASYLGAALTPDNYLITPQVELKGTLRFMAKGQDPSWADEHFAVYVSTAGNTDVADFTEVLSEQVVTGEYQQYEVDLSSYEGQQGYIAIRHFNVTDMFRLNVDNFGIYGADEVAAGEWINVEDVASPYSLTGLTAETEYEVQVQGVTGGVTSDWTASVLFTTSEATGINRLNIAGQENWYTIDGRKLAKRPTTTGVYILNGQKVMIK